MRDVKLILGILTAIFLFAGGLAADNIDPDNLDEQYAWSENGGWINAEPQGPRGPGLVVNSTGVTGWAWAENLGWISFSCANTGSCARVDYGVTHDGKGGLGGYAWSENTGWISFSCKNTGTCSLVNYAAGIDPDTGQFSGRAWSENTGWINFDAFFNAGVVTSWRKGGCLCDLEPDGDVDGADLADYARHFGLPGRVSLDVFALEFASFCDGGG